VILALDPRVYYLYPAYPILLAAGSVMCESWLAGSGLKRTKFDYPVMMVLTGALAAPFALPVLPVKTYIRYSKAMHFQQPPIENWKLGPLPQVYADQFGWEEMVAAVARVYNGLPANLRAKTAIFAQNYGQAGAIDFFGPKYGLPKAISGHQNYFFWGPRDFTGESVIVLQGWHERLKDDFASITKVASVYHPYSMPTEHFLSLRDSPPLRSTRIVVDCAKLGPSRLSPTATTEHRSLKPWMDGSAFAQRWGISPGNRCTTLSNSR
ncbi:MAG: hypothetical protein WB586_30515, partial [Chthoniobacterales bacterium]